MDNKEPQICKGCKKHQVDNDSEWPGYCPWCCKKIDDGFDTLKEHRGDQDFH
jgi:hypothetical protein